MQIKTVGEFEQALAAGPYAFPGGYPHYFITADGAALSFDAATEEADLIREAIKDNDRQGGFMVTGMDVNWENPSLYCDHTSKRIESAYAEPEEQEA